MWLVSLSRGWAIAHGPSYMRSVSLANGISTITISEEPQSVIEQSTIDASTSYSLPILERAYNPPKSQHGEPGNNSTCQRRRVCAWGGQSRFTIRLHCLHSSPCDVALRVVARGREEEDILATYMSGCGQRYLRSRVKWLGGIRALVF